MFLDALNLGGFGHRRPVRAVYVKCQLGFVFQKSPVTVIQSVRRMSGPLREIDDSRRRESGERWYGAAEVVQQVGACVG